MHPRLSGVGMDTCCSATRRHGHSTLATQRVDFPEFHHATALADHRCRSHAAEQRWTEQESWCFATIRLPGLFVGTATM